MKAKAIRSFIDKYSGHIYKVNEIFECSEERFDEVRKFAVAIKEEPTKATPRKK